MLHSSRMPAKMLPLLLLPLLATDLWAAPLTRYDQRQEGELNVHAHLENFVILLIPSGSGLFNFAAKVSPAKHHHGKHAVKSSVEGSVKQQSSEAAAAVAPGVKSPPYRVDIDEDRRLPIVLEISGPRIRAEDVQDEVVIAESPVVSLTRAPTKEEEAEPVKEEEKPLMEEKPQEPVKEEAPKKDEKESNDVPEPHAQPEKEPAKAPVPPQKPTEKPTEAAAAQPEPPKKEATAAAAKGDETERKTVTSPPGPEPTKSVAPAAPTTPAAPVPAVPAEPVPQEAKARSARLELLAQGLEPFPAPACGPHEHRASDGRCRPVYAPARISKSFADRELLQKLRFGLAPASN